MKSQLGVVCVVAFFALVMDLAETGRLGSAAEPAASSSLKLRHLQEAESEGKGVNREPLPQDSNANRWAAGNIKTGDAWKNILELNGDMKLPDSYIQQRMASDESEQSQLKLARWCKRQGLSEQATAHYFGALFANPNNLEARRELKHEWINDRWFTAKEIEQAHGHARKHLDDLEAWVPELNKILRKLQSTNRTQQLAAIQQLESIDDASAIAAMEVAISVVDQPVALPLIKCIAKFRSPEACRTLLAIAVGEPTSPLSQAALKELRDYPEAMVIPELLSAMSTPVDMSYNVVGLPNGRLTLTTSISRELKDRRYIQRFENQLRVLSQVSSNVSVIKTENRQTTNPRLRLSGEIEERPRNVSFGRSADRSAAAQYVPEVVFASAHAELRDRAQQLEQRIAAENQRIQENTQRICSVLRALTSETFGDDPVAWWTWWSDRNEKKYEQSKSVKQDNYYHQEQLILSTTRSTSLGARSYTEGENPLTRERSASDLRRLRRGLLLRNLGASCLVAGTLVQTAEGLRPIEEIQCGDLVSAQDVETGELALKPVIRTTQGPPRNIVRIVTQTGEIRGTGGHFWWVAGHGWKRGRELESGMQLHTATGTVEVQKVVDEIEPQPTYNLVVDDFHTYFVGAERVLSYDITPLEGTLRIVPGYDHLATKR